MLLSEACSNSYDKSKDSKSTSTTDNQSHYRNQQPDTSAGRNRHSQQNH
jgi:hypothetical protein